MLRIASILLLLAAGFIWFGTDTDRAELSDLARTDTPCGLLEQKCSVDGRTYNALIPRGAGPFPAVVFFHGSGGSGADVILHPDITEPLLRNGYAILAPDALDITYAGGNRSSGWIWQGQRHGRDDHQFVENVVSDAASRFPIDPENLIIVGHSNGATFVWYLACQNTDPRLKNFATIGGTPVRSRPLACNDPRRPFNLFHTHGRNDKVVPVQGTQRTATWHGWLGAEEAMLMLSDGGNCTKREAPRTADGLQRIDWSVCASELQLRLDIVNGGHGIPGHWGDALVEWTTQVSKR